ncbi:hypothetical protein FA95DRAFT_1614097 [Auriscalpium vulgare]|uniref:Uncharacterized protein n=1 Tax=Auriscalpium vulgare TaxID=40419 RepID=A0ACB8R0W3_9AGAM|nr:hypothetical protein FA95DRAFT_1614097 [Auriscalpium vulgare]
MQDAASPFADNARADVILRSSDEVRFRVSKLVLVLAIASPDMLAGAADETYHGLPVVPMAEAATTLDLLLDVATPSAHPTRTAARAALRVPLPEVASSPAVNLLSSGLITLIQYHPACGVAAP